MDRSTDTPTEPYVEPRRIPIAALAALVAAITGNWAIYRIGRATEAIPEEIPDGMAAFGVPSILLLTVVTLTAAAIAMWLFTRFSVAPIRNFTTLTIIIFITSLPPLFNLEIGTDFRFALIAMHALTAACAWWFLTRLTQPGR